MPLMRCTKNGKSGWKYGVNGTCYVGEDAKQKAVNQGIASGEIKVTEKHEKR